MVHVRFVGTRSISRSSQIGIAHPTDPVDPVKKTPNLHAVTIHKCG
jgi:hypothetical protein